jgi:hypothetical protein
MMMTPVAMPVPMVLRLGTTCHPQNHHQTKHTQQDSFHLSSPVGVRF